MLTKASGPILRRRHLSWTSGGMYNPVNWFYTAPVPPVTPVIIPDTPFSIPVDMEMTMVSVGSIVDSTAIAQQMSNLALAIPDAPTYGYVLSALLDKDITEMGLINMLGFINPMTYIGWYGNLLTQSKLRFFSVKEKPVSLTAKSRSCCINRYSNANCITSVDWFITWWINSIENSNNARSK